MTCSLTPEVISCYFCSPEASARTKTAKCRSAYKLQGNGNNTNDVPVPGNCHRVGYTVGSEQLLQLMLEA